MMNGFSNILLPPQPTKDCALLHLCRRPAWSFTCGGDHILQSAMVSFPLKSSSIADETKTRQCGYQMAVEFGKMVGCNDKDWNKIEVNWNSGTCTTQTNPTPYGSFLHPKSWLPCLLTAIPNHPTTGELALSQVALPNFQSAFQLMGWWFSHAICAMADFPSVPSVHFWH